jgi:hypothetical protein
MSFVNIGPLTVILCLGRNRISAHIFHISLLIWVKFGAGHLSHNAIEL